MEKMGISHVPGNLGTYIYSIFYVKDQVDSNKISKTYCSTENMFEYFLTKALQGALFVRFRGVIMGWKHIDTLQMGPPSTKENVGNID